MTLLWIEAEGMGKGPWEVVSECRMSASVESSAGRDEEDLSGLKVSPNVGAPHIRWGQIEANSSLIRAWQVYAQIGRWELT